MSEKNTKNENTENVMYPDLMGGYVLYEGTEFDWDKFIEILKDEWNIIPQIPVEDNTLALVVNDMNVAVTFKDEPLEQGVVEEAASHNVMWADGREEVKKHKSQAILIVAQRITPIAQALLFAKMAYCLLKMPGAIGVYKEPTVFEKQFYLNFAETIKEDELPMPILVYSGLYHNAQGFSAFTSGLRFFGKEEIEILGSHKDPDQIMGFLLTVAEYSVTQNVDFKDGETLGFSDTQRYPIKVSEGVSVKGNSVKIIY